MPNYCVTVTEGVFDIEADDEDDAREQALDMADVDVELVPDIEDEEDEEDEEEDEID